MTKEAKSEYNRKYRLANIEKMRAHGRAWREQNRDIDRAKSSAWYYANKDKARMTQKARYHANKAKNQEKQKAYRKANGRHLAAYKRFHAYGITQPQYDAMLLSQNGTCAIGDHQFESAAVVCVDHDHFTGAVRGLLCSKHNTAIGMFDESIPAMAAAVKYLSDHGK